MTKIRFTDNTQLEVHSIIKSQKFVDNSNRELLTIKVLPQHQTLQTLVELFADSEKTKILTVIDNSGEEFIYDFYTCYVSCANCREIEYDENHDPKEAIYNVIEIARSTYLERQMEAVMQIPSIREALKAGD